MSEKRKKIVIEGQTLETSTPADPIREGGEVSGETIEPEFFVSVHFRDGLEPERAARRKRRWLH